uniref:Peptidylglycine alpha-amidating monooxygenase n=1 Tax=Calliactis parasitica TaxID=6114 RepID=Q9GQN2_CALPA|nr:peptidylglycine alpha-amidating monooxygenase [Calliactis parasitica]
MSGLFRYKFFSLVSLLSLAIYSNGASFTTLPIRMPGAKPLKNDAYLCTAVKLPSRSQYIVRFEPKSDPKIAHHMLLFGCNQPGSKESIWDCGSSSECNGDNNILFAWANGATAKNLPKGVGFKVGKTAKINYIVLQVHYKHKLRKDAKSDNSGFVLHSTPQRQPYLAGIFLLWSGDVDIPPEKTGVHSDIVCQYNQQTTMYAFAYRTHAHGLGRVITGYEVKHNNWTLLGRGNPQEPQAFYPMDGIHKISTGDKLAARCTYDSKGHHLPGHVYIGSTGKDEMCNFYIMYYRDANEPEVADAACSDQTTHDYSLTFPVDSDAPLKTKSSTHKIHETPATKSPDHKHSSKSHTVTKKPIQNNHKQISTSPLKHEESNTHMTKHKMPENPSQPSTSSVENHHHNSQLMDNYKIVKNWPKLDQDHLGQLTGVALDSKGHVLLFHRGKRTWNINSFNENNEFLIDTPIQEFTVLTLNANTGTVIGRWGKNMFYLPHGLTVDHHDNIWLTDVGSHQVFKFPSNGGSKPLLVLGEKFVPNSDESHFCKPTAVAVEKSGNFYVADGYCNSRIVKFTAKGKFVDEWGQYGLNKGSFDVPHSLALDEASHRLYIADRENSRVQSLDTTTGLFDPPIYSQQFELIFAVDFNPHSGLLHAINGNSYDKNGPVKGFTLRATDGHLLKTWPSVKQHFTHPHDIISSADDVDLYVVEVGPNKVWKLSKRKPFKLHDNKASFPAFCMLEHDTGPCRAAMPRWYFDAKARSCTRFIYGGCSGNENNFASKRECEAKCTQIVNSNKQQGKDNSGHISEMTLNNLPSKQGKQEEDTKRTEVSSSLPYHGNNTAKPMTLHETDDWRNAAGEDEGNESNLHAAAVWRQHHNTSTNLTTPHLIEKNRQNSNDNISAGGMIPALVILSVLAVPIVFLLLISIALRIRAYRRDTRYKANRLLKTDNEGLAVGHTRGWLSYLNCFKRQTYGFDKVNMAEFYSDSDSDGV